MAPTKKLPVMTRKRKAETGSTPKRAGKKKKADTEAAPEVKGNDVDEDPEKVAEEILNELVDKVAEEEEGKKPSKPQKAAKPKSTDPKRIKASMGDRLRKNSKSILHNARHEVINEYLRARPDVARSIRDKVEAAYRDGIQRYIAKDPEAVEMSAYFKRNVEQNLDFNFGLHIDNDDDDDDEEDKADGDGKGKVDAKAADKTDEEAKEKADDKE